VQSGCVLVADVVCLVLRACSQHVWILSTYVVHTWEGCLFVRESVLLARLPLLKSSSSLSLLST
jgi:hypothetical protein